MFRKLHAYTAVAFVVALAIAELALQARAAAGPCGGGPFGC